jgi:hypothetical protein
MSTCVRERAARKIDRKGIKERRNPLRAVYEKMFPVSAGGSPVFIASTTTFTATTKSNLL